MSAKRDSRRRGATFERSSEVTPRGRRVGRVTVALALSAAICLGRAPRRATPRSAASTATRDSNAGAGDALFNGELHRLSTTSALGRNGNA